MIPGTVQVNSDTTDVFPVSPEQVSNIQNSQD